MKKKTLIKSIITMLLGVIITTGTVIAIWGGERPDPEMSAIEYKINI